MAIASDFHKRVGELVRARRTALRLSQADLGKILGVAASAIFKREEGSTAWSVQDLMTLAQNETLDFKIIDFFTIEITQDPNLQVLPNVSPNTVTFAPGALEITLDTAGKELTRVEIAPNDREAIDRLNKNLEALAKGFRGSE